MATSKKFDLSSTTAIEDAAISVSASENRSKAETLDLIAELVGICPTDKKGQEGWLATSLPALVRAWDSKRDDKSGALLIADSDSIKSARKRLVGLVKAEVEGRLDLDFSFVGKSRKTKEGVNVTFYQWISTEDAEELADDRERAAAERKDKKAKEAESAIQERITEATRNMVPQSDYNRLKSSIVDPETCTDDDALMMLGKWARECARRGLDVSTIILRNSAPTKPAMPDAGKRKRAASK